MADLFEVFLACGEVGDGATTVDFCEAASWRDGESETDRQTDRQTYRDIARHRETESKNQAWQTCLRCFSRVERSVVARLF